MGDCEGEAEGVGVLEGDDLPAANGAAVVHHAIVGADAAKGLGVYEYGRAEHPAGEVDVPYLAPAAPALVHDVDCVGGDAVGEMGRLPLVHYDVARGAPHVRRHRQRACRWRYCCRCRRCYCINYSLLVSIPIYTFLLKKQSNT